jgi:hypothetical protein
LNFKQNETTKPRSFIMDKEEVCSLFSCPPQYF